MTRFDAFAPPPPEDKRRAPREPEKAPPVPPELFFSEAEINEIAKAVFSPDEGFVNEAVKFYTGQQKLEGYQKVLLAPANAFEGIVQFGISLFDSETYSNLAALIETIGNPAARRNLLALIGKGWEKCTPAEKTAFVVEMISLALTSVGAMSKLKRIIPADKLKFLTRYAAARRLKTLGTAVLATPADETAAAVMPMMGEAAMGKPAASEERGRKKK